MKHFWQFLIIVISWKHVRRRPICFVTAHCVGAFYSPAIFAMLHRPFVFKHWILLCCCLILVATSIGSKSRDGSFWWCSLHEVIRHGDACSTISVDILIHAYPGGCSPYLGLLALLMYAYLGEYRLTLQSHNYIVLTASHLGAVLCKRIRSSVYICLVFCWQRTRKRPSLCCPWFIWVWIRYALEAAGRHGEEKNWEREEGDGRGTHKTRGWNAECNLRIPGRAD